MSRTLQATGTPGWFKDLADPDGPKVRKREGDQVLTLEQAAAANGAGNGNRGTEAAKAAVAKAAPTTVADTGKILVGKTIEIECQWPGCKATRTIKPQDRFQVRYCVAHQQEHRKQMHREKQQRRAKARREAKAKQPVTA